MSYAVSMASLITLSHGHEDGGWQGALFQSVLGQDAIEPPAVFPWQWVTLVGLLGLFGCALALALLMRYGTAQGSVPAVTATPNRRAAPAAAAPEPPSPIFYRYQSVWPRLLVTSGPQVGMVYPLPECAVHVGSGPENDITLQGTSLAAAHVKICHQREGYYLNNLDQDGFTQLNGTRLESKALLCHNDQIQLGRTVTLCYRDK